MKKLLVILIFFVLTVSLPSSALAKSRKKRNDRNSWSSWDSQGSRGSRNGGGFTTPWYYPPYEPYQYKFHVLPNGDAYWATPGADYLPYYSRWGY